MRSSIPRLSYFSTGLAALAMSLASGCQIYIDPGDGNGGGGGAVDAGVPYPDAGGCYGDDPVPLPPYDSGVVLRDPFTGECVDFGWGGWDPCLPVPPVPPPPPWGSCDSACSAYDFDELGCVNAYGCQAAYTRVAQPDGQESTTFIGCWDNGDDLSGDPSWACESLDPWYCSMRDDCSPLYEDGYCFPDAAGQQNCVTGGFAACMAEVVPGCISDDQCGPGWACEIPDSCGVEPPCSGAPDQDCSTCAGTCVPAAGSCGGEVFCDAEPPGCPPNRVPGVSNGCWTGQCILLEDCEPPMLDCRAIASQEECLAQDACMPVYGGLGCTCDDSGCTCREWVFEGCTNR